MDVFQSESGQCRENIHGHSYIVEVFITSDKLDDGYMVMDFCRLDKVKEFIESFDHSYSLWQKEPPDFKTFVYRYNRRVAEIPVSPSAEGYALLFTYVIDKILRHTERVNGEGNIQLHAVRNFDDIGMAVDIFPAPLRGTITDNMRPFEFELFSNQHTQKHDKELKSAIAIAKAAGVKEHKIVNLLLNQWSGCALTDPDMSDA